MTQSKRRKHKHSY